MPISQSVTTMVYIIMQYDKPITIITYNYNYNNIIFVISIILLFSQAMSLIEAKQRLPPPPGCPRAVYELMINCW